MNPPSKTAGVKVSVFKTQTRPVNFPLITLHSSQSKGGALHIPFHLTSASETETGVGFEGRDEGCSQRRGRGGGDSQAESLIFFAPGVCAAAAAVALSLSED